MRARENGTGTRKTGTGYSKREEFPMSTFDVLSESVSRRSVIKQVAALGLVASSCVLLSAETVAGERTTLSAKLHTPRRLASEGQYDVRIDYAVQFSDAHIYDLHVRGSVFYVECRFWDWDGTSSDDIIYAWHFTNNDLPGDSSRRAPADRITGSALDGNGQVSGSFRKRMTWTWLDQDNDVVTESFYAGLHLIDAQTRRDVLGVDPWHSNHVDLHVPL